MRYMLATRSNSGLTCIYKKDVKLNSRLEPVAVKSKLRLYEFLLNEAINKKFFELYWYQIL